MRSALDEGTLEHVRSRCCGARRLDASATTHDCSWQNETSTGRLVGDRKPTIKPYSLEWDTRLRRPGLGDSAGKSEGKQLSSFHLHKQSFDKNSMTFASRCGGNLEHRRPCPTLGPRR